MDIGSVLLSLLRYCAEKMRLFDSRLISHLKVKGLSLRFVSAPYLSYVFRIFTKLGFNDLLTETIESTKRKI